MLQYSKNRKLGMAMKKLETINLKVEKEILLLEFLYQNIKEKSKNNIKSLLKNGQIFVNSKKQTKFNFLLKKGDEITVRLKRIEYAFPLFILYEDDSLIAIEKPAGLLTIATENEKEKTAYHAVKKYLCQKGQKVFIVHRLDRDTSGILLFAKNEKMKIMLQKHWNAITLKRGYIAIIEGHIKPDFGTIRSFLKEEKNQTVHSTKNEMDGKLAITRYKTKLKSEEYSLLEIFLDTGRKNQIRVHMSEAGHPIIGDQKYFSEKNPIHRLGLHSHILEFIHPFTKKVIRLESLVPKEFNQLFKKTKNYEKL